MQVEDRPVTTVPETEAAPAAVAEETIPNGPAVAAFLASGIGALALGILVTLADISTDFANFLKFGNDAVGPLFGKTLVAVLVYVIAWVALHATMRNKNYKFSTMMTTSSVLVALGFLLTFPPVFEFIADLFK